MMLPPHLMLLVFTAYRTADAVPMTGKYVVIGSSQPILAAPGDNVILPCHIEPMLDITGLTVEWSRLDMKPDPQDRLSRVEYIHLYRDRKEVPDMKFGLYLGRTELSIENLRYGTMSLKILNVSQEDSAEYRCFVPKLRSNVKSATIRLLVGPIATSSTASPMYSTSITTPDTDLPGQGRPRIFVGVAGIFFALVVLAVAGVYCYRRRSEPKVKSSYLQESHPGAINRIRHPHKNRLKKETSSQMWTKDSNQLSVSHHQPNH